jgi:RNA polymerase sigma-70 factor (ECF subfamily)
VDGLDALVDAIPDVPGLDSSFADLYQRHHRDVYRYVLASTRSHDEADDVTAETFERAYSSWSSGTPEPGRVVPWLLLTARRIATDRWRRIRRLARITPPTRLRHADGADQGRAEFWLWFDALSAALPGRQREVLLLRYQRDLTDADIALVMGLTESGVRSLVARALESLRAHPELLP